MKNIHVGVELAQNHLDHRPEQSYNVNLEFMPWNNNGIA